MSDIDTTMALVLERARFDLVDAYVAAAEAGAARMTRELVEMARVFEAGLADAEVARINQSVARQARLSVIRSYDQTVGHGGGPPGYRAGASGKMRRWAGGRLRRALSQGDYLVGDARGITMVTGPLDRAARQWARLNFGALGRGQGSLPPRTITFGDLVIAVVGLEEGPRPGFSLPAGYWLPGGDGNGPDPARRGSDAFYVSSRTHDRIGRLRARQAGSSGRPRQGSVLSKGIASRNFLDQGVHRIAVELPREYQLAYTQLFRRGIATVRPGNVNVSVSGRVRRPADLTPFPRRPARGL